MDAKTISDIVGNIVGMIILAGVGVAIWKSGMFQQMADNIDISKKEVEALNRIAAALEKLQK